MRTFGRPRVLVCDDEDSVRSVCVRALLAAGYDPVATRRGEEAITALENDSFDAALVDIRMPGLDGPDVIGELRTLDPDLPCVVMSGYSSFDDAVRCLHHGAVDFVRKPFDLDVLVRSVDRAIATTHLKSDHVLLAATRSIFASLDTKEIARRVLDVARSMLNASEVWITLAANGEPVETLHLADGATAARSLAPVAPQLWRRLSDIREPAVFDGQAAADTEVVTAMAPGARALVTHRLAIGERLVGLLAGARPQHARDYGERDLRRASLLAGHASLALENARLHGEVETQARELDHAIDRLIAAERVAVVSRLAASLGHEISNPACAVLASLELAEGAIAHGRDRDAGEQIARARAGANAIVDLCQALRPLSQGRGARADLIDLRQVIDGAMLIASYEVRPRARLTIATAPDLPLLRGDSARLGQVFLNLLLNAAQAIPGGSPEQHEIRISAEVAPGGAAIIARVEDTGPGVDPALVPLLFEPTATTRAAAEGHGMGLAICRWIVEEAGGTIRHVPGRARGAEFEIRLPL